MSTLREDLDALWRYKAIPAKLPESVTGNLNSSLPLRPYQREALARLFWYLNKDEVHPVHLLFHMATGSGKTLIMAASIFHLYEHGYHNFIFFVNRDNIINKTRENFLNQRSSKYQFAERLKLGTKEIQIREVENFENIHPDDINILFTTIQGLHSRLNAPRENSLTYEDFGDKKIVLISDEAHHINALTKSKKDLQQDELLALDTWEATVQRIFNTRPDNIMLEFTATVELDNEAIATKYKDKILYEYPLKKYREDGYSKEVNVMQIDLPTMERALQAVILSQYRRKVAEKNNLFLKPVILMKSRLIIDSRKFEAEFKATIAKLTANDLERLRQEAAKAPVLKQAFDYFEKQNIALENLALELREDFGENRCLSVNSKEESEEKQLLVNSLEDHTNEIRVIFAVDKLNEGWDVLNLFDIVRLYNTRDAKHNIPGKTTISEAQLIGRGARYFPFKLNDSQTADQRKFDSELDNELRILEELYYHSQHNPDYISELHKALVQTGIVPSRTRMVQTRVKDSFKQTDFWKNGVVFVNKRVINPREDIFGLKNIEFTKLHTYRLSSGFAQEAMLLGSDVPVQGEETKTQIYNLIDFGDAVIRKAISKLDFYQFSNLKHYFPHLKSITEFITSDDYLKPVSVDVSGNPEQIKDLTADDKLNIAVRVMEKIAHEIVNATPEVVGTKVFEPLAIRVCVKDKFLEISFNDGGEQEHGLGMRETTNLTLNLDLRDKAWYIYDENYGTSEEKYFIKFMHSAIDRLQKKYSEIYLLRNEQLFTIYRFSDGSAMQPDFVLFTVEKNSGKTIIYQLFVEPKGGNLLVEDKWKEDFLKEIEKEYKIQVLFENKEFRLIGMPFYNEIITKTLFENRFSEALLG